MATRKTSSEAKTGSSTPVAARPAKKIREKLAPDRVNAASRLGLPLYVGTSGWAYSIWKPEFYPQDVASKNFLKYYASLLTAVEVNYTFRRLLSEKAAASWMDDAGPGFRFAVKANQNITHFRRLKDAEQPVRAFLSCIAPLQRRKALGPVLFQLPPNLKPTSDCCATSSNCCLRSCRLPSSSAMHPGSATKFTPFSPTRMPPCA